jgi:hypothetical protein
MEGTEEKNNTNSSAINGTNHSGSGNHQKPGVQRGGSPFTGNGSATNNTNHIATNGHIQNQHHYQV